MTDEPSYIAALNAIAVSERRGSILLDAWRQVTEDPALADLLEQVAIRARAHAAAFTKRLCELGRTVQEAPGEAFDEALACAASRAADAEKFRLVLGYPCPGTPGADPLARLFDDRTLDPETGALLGRYIAEQRDSERRLRAACDRLTPAPEPAHREEDEDSLLADIALRLDRLARTLDELKQLRR